MESSKSIPPRIKSKMTKAELTELIEVMRVEIAQKDSELEAMSKAQEELSLQIQKQDEKQEELENQLANLDTSEKTIQINDSGSKYSFRIDFYEAGETSYNGKISLLSTQEMQSFQSINMETIEAFMSNYLPLKRDVKKEIVESIPPTNEQASSDQITYASRSIPTEPNIEQSLFLPQLETIEVIKNDEEQITHQVHLSEGFRIRLQLDKDAMEELDKIAYQWDCEIFAKNLDTGKFSRLKRSERQGKVDSIIISIGKHNLIPASYRLEINMSFYGKNGEKIPVTSFKEGAFLRIYG